MQSLVGVKLERFSHLKVNLEIFKQPFLLAWATIVGLIIGILPAIGGSASSVMAYDQAKKFSKTPERFGKGHPEGIIASEASNNANVSGSLMTIMAFGIPGDAVTAVMLGAMTIHGIQSGPLFISQNPDLAYGIYAAYILAHPCMLLICVVLMPLMLRVTSVRMAVLAPVVLVLCVVGAYALNNTMQSVYVLLLFGVVGYVLVKLGFPLAPLILGLILGDQIEINLVRAIMTDAESLAVPDAADFRRAAAGGGGSRSRWRSGSICATRTGWSRKSRISEPRSRWHNLEKSVRPDLRIAVVGLGAIGTRVVEALDRGIDGLVLTAVSVQNPEKHRSRLAGLTRPPAILPIEALVDVADIVIECAPSRLVRSIVAPFVSAGKTAVVLSAGALLDHDDLIELAKQHGGQIVVPTGALIGLDAVTAAAVGTIHSVRMITRKPPGGLAGAPYIVDNNIDIDGITEPRRIFDGTAREAAKGFPANVNVAAALSLAGIGPDRTTIEIWADPTVTRNMHRIEVDSDSARFSDVDREHPVGKPEDRA